MKTIKQFVFDGAVPQRSGGFKDRPILKANIDIVPTSEYNKDYQGMDDGKAQQVRRLPYFGGRP